MGVNKSSTWHSDCLSLPCLFYNSIGRSWGYLFWIPHNAMLSVPDALSLQNKSLSSPLWNPAIISFVFLSFSLLVLYPVGLSLRGRWLVLHGHTISVFLFLFWQCSTNLQQDQSGDSFADLFICYMWENSMARLLSSIHCKGIDKIKCMQIFSMYQ